jgi:hypothetical protein
LLKASHIIPPTVALVVMAVWNVGLWRSIVTEKEALRIPLGNIRETDRNRPSSSVVGALGPRKRPAETPAPDDELSEMDPDPALATFAKRLEGDDPGMARRLAKTFVRWAAEDPAAAAAWLDRQIADGLFESKSLDGRSLARLEFEAALLGILLSTDEAAAATRLAALPEDQRREVMERISVSELSPTGQSAYAALIRSLIPPDERPGAFAHAASELATGGGFSGVGEFLDQIGATPPERAVSAREAANARLETIAAGRAVTRDDAETLREWVKRQSPGTVDRVTGEALAEAAQANGKLSFEAAAELALEYHKNSGNDDVLGAFLESFAAHSNLARALPLVRDISDPKRRDEILGKLKPN